MNNQTKGVSMSVIRRLPKYYRYLRDLENKGEKKISSQKLAQLMGLTASQIRQDLNSFGAYGQQGYGYNISELKEVVKDILGLNNYYHCILIGGGNMGKAIANYERYQRDGIIIDAIFDIEPQKIDTFEDIDVYPMESLEEYTNSNKVDIAILTVPKEAGQEVAQRLEEIGIKAILNFVPIDLNLSEDVRISNVNINDGFYTLTYFLNQ